MPATPRADLPSCAAEFTELLRTRFEFWETWCERVASFLDTHREEGPELCTLLLLILPVPKHGTPVGDKPSMSDEQCEAATRWVELAEKSDEPNLFGPLRRGVSAAEAGAHLWFVLEAARRVNANAGAAQVLLRLFMETALFPYAGVDIPTPPEGYRMNDAIGLLMKNPMLFARVALTVSRHHHTSTEIGPILAQLSAQVPDDAERAALLTLAYGFSMYYVLNARPQGMSVRMLSPEALLAAIGSAPPDPEEAAIELDVSDKTKLN